MPHQLHAELQQRIESHAWLTRRPRLFPLMVFALVILSVIAGAMTTEQAERRSERQRLDSAAMETVRFFRQVETTHAAMLRGSSLFLSQVPITQDEFEILAGSGLHSIDVEVAEGIGWALARPAARPGGPASMKITFLAPNTERNRRAIGFDMYAEPNRRAAIETALRTRVPTATAPIVLAQENPGSQEHGFLLFSPVYGARGQFKGMLYAAYRGNNFLAATQTRLATRPSYIALDDVTAGSAIAIGALGARAPSLKYATRLVIFGGRQWRVTVGIEGATVLATSTMWIVLIGLVMAGLALLLARQFVMAALDERKFFEWQGAQLQVRNTLMLELNHRVKNTLANVLSIITLTRRKAADVDSFADSLSGRIRALSATHDILTAQQWNAATLESIVRAELAPYLAANDLQAEISGPEIALAPNTALSLGLAIHELVTNAAKYGALSRDEGRVSISWSLEDPQTARLEWRERGGPRVVAPDRFGFGTNLLRKTVSHELGRDVELDFAPDGLRASLFVPLRTVQEFSLRQGPRD
ncbi:HWE histidine kinase domain-containing protein [Novosphingobium sp.]|uniref:sensor histidine kinase n=1 Tax=Novosphingobium sp. TaxID=1874826 RepID=UPI00286ADD3E|nr:HWE histidine kinase domain-containing protein [Novosphingobium sp.]